MRRARLGILFLFFVLQLSTNCFATHIFGGDLLYTHISDSTYQVTLTIYGDCGASSSIFQTLYTATPSISIADGTVGYKTITLNISEAGTEVSPVCTAQLGNTKCNGGTLPGVRRFRYTNTVVIPYRSAHWSFIFGGNMSNNTAGISTSVTNIVQTTNSSLMYLTANLDNSSEDNSSPAYSSIPTPFYCVKVPQQYNQGAIDADGDSLSFSLVPAIDGNTSANINYVYPYSGSNPLSVDAGTYDFNVLNGQVTFTPSIIQDALVVCRVDEYRKGVLIGSSERELTFVVLDNCKGTPPSSSVTVNAGGAIAAGSSAAANVVNVCVNTPNVNFSIAINNPDGDNTILGETALPTGAALTFNGNNTPSPSAVFSWSTGNVPVGIYTFYLTIQNDHCPLATRATVAYTINVTPFPEISYKQLSATQCVYSAGFEFDTKYGYTPRTITISKGATIVKTGTDTSGYFTDSLASGNYSVSVSSNPQCLTTIPLFVNDSGKLPLLPVVNNYCINSTPVLIDVSPINTLAVITWYSITGEKLFYAPYTETSEAGETHYYFTEQFAQCYSDKVPVTTVIHALPTPVLQSISRPATICLGDTIALKATGGVSYSWGPKDKVFADTAGSYYTRVTTPELIQVTATDSFSCTDSATYEYKDIQYCCQFSYPNAFTPNHDGKNDGFGIVSYGNLVQYDLIIYNRWGQQVFHTTEPGKYWDGTFNGIPCDIGTYSYYFKAQCLTGNKEVSKGDVTLIR